MRTLKSLVKKSGGWKKISKTALPDFENQMLDEIKANIKNGIIKNDLDFNLSNLDILLENLVIAINMIQAKTLSEKFSAYGIIPKCVLLKIILYNSEKNYVYDKSKSSYIKNILFNFLNEKYIFETLIAMTKNISGLFVWGNRPEGFPFWDKLEGELSHAKKTNAITNFDYTPFVKANPKSKIEIEDFCKKN